MKLKTLYIIVLALIMASIILIMISSFSDIAHYTSTEPNAAPLKVIIDAGHGGEDGGAEADGILEKDINLAISRKLAEMLRRSGCDVTEVRDTDTAVYSEGASTYREKKVSDLENRVKLFNSDENNIVVSIHQNKFGDSKYSGAQIFYSENDPKSALLADCIRTAIVYQLQPENTRELKKAGDDIYILKNATVPALIVECGFISNDAERALLTNESYQHKLAYAIAMGILGYSNTIKTEKET